MILERASDDLRGARRPAIDENDNGFAVGQIAGYLLIPSLGLSLTGYLAAFLNLSIAAASWYLSIRSSDTEPRDVSQASRDDQPLLAARHRLVLVGVELFLDLA